ncbi:MAG: metal ABC transporter ATP-binding protein [Rhodospirillales bacterium]|nr:metal ABC transporter ATP-binding protein [Rhodospirillales bacterium]
MSSVRAATLVAARDIGVRRSERWIIRHVDVQVPRGALVYVIGANGAGKSTCAKALLGLIEIDEGAVERESGVAVGYVPQRLTISPTLPLRLRRLMTLTRHYPRRDIETALTAVGLERLGNPPISTLSGGEFQRLLLARALIEKPDLLVLDEPVQGVDVSGADIFHELIEEVRRSLGCGILIVSHDIELAARTGDDVVVLVPHEHDEKTLARWASFSSEGKDHDADDAQAV